MAAKCVNKRYLAKEKAEYQKEKAGERRVKKEGSVAPGGRLNTGCGQKPTRVLIRMLSINENLATNASDAESKTTLGNKVESQYKYRLYIEGKERPNNSPHSHQRDTYREPHVRW